jgi:cell division protein FtsI/penicillin-binding protein 2
MKVKERKLQDVLQDATRFDLFSEEFDRLGTDDYQYEEERSKRTEKIIEFLRLKEEEVNNIYHYGDAGRFYAGQSLIHNNLNIPMDIVIYDINGKILASNNIKYLVYYDANYQMSRSNVVLLTKKHLQNFCAFINTGKYDKNIFEESDEENRTKTFMTDDMKKDILSEEKVLDYELAVKKIDDKWVDETSGEIPPEECKYRPFGLSLTGNIRLIDELSEDDLKYEFD